jgi:hypothetical protein
MWTYITVERAVALHRRVFETMMCLTEENTRTPVREAAWGRVVSCWFGKPRQKVTYRDPWARNRTRKSCSIYRAAHGCGCRCHCDRERDHCRCPLGPHLECMPFEGPEEAVVETVSRPLLLLNWGNDKWGEKRTR